ncbi:MAG: hypothetical protein HWE10_14405 [Gammaproteobacteria bacterium]|nr:hypothetical protein [Gammaproteobacteria bacterium]
MNKTRILLFIICCLSACDSSKVALQISDQSAETVSFFNLEYRNHKLSHGELELDTVYTATVSENQQYIIYSQMIDGWTEVFLWDAFANAKQQLTDNNLIEFEVTVNNQARFAYTVEQNSGNGSLIYLDNVVLDLPQGMYKNLAMNNNWLVFNGYDSSTDTNSVWIYNLNNETLNSWSVEVFPNKIVWDGSQFVIDGIDSITFENNVYYVDVVNKSIAAQGAGSNACYYVNGQVNCYSQSQTQAKLIQMIQNELSTNDPMFALACGTGFDGRLSWTVSYRLHSLIKLFELQELAPELYKKVNYPLEAALNYGVNCLLSNVGVYQSEGHLFWPTKKYSIDKEQLLSLAVNDGMVLYPLIRAANRELLSNEQVQALKPLIEQYYKFHEKDFDKELGLYRFSYGSPFWADGVVLPWNMSAAMALTFAEAYKLTQYDRYKNRAVELTQKFVDSWVYKNEGQLMWHYWPDVFYQGWTQEDNVSVNTPSWPTKVDTLYEDLSHAGVNIWLINSILNSSLGESITVGAFEVEIANTTQGIERNGKYSRFMSGDGKYQFLSRRYMPRLGWVELGNCELNADVVKGYPWFTAQFAQNNELNYITLLLNEFHNESSRHCFK